MKAYIATKISNQEAARNLASALIERGWGITSRWFSQEAEQERPASTVGPEWDVYADKWAERDIDDISAADAVILLPVEGCVGTWVEFGVSIALHKDIFYVGRDFTVFSHLLPKGRRFSSVEDFLALCPTTK